MLRGKNSAFAVIFDHISARRRSQLYLLLLLLLLGATADLFAIASVVPFLSLLTGSDVLERFGIVQSLFDALGATSQRDRVLVVSAIFALAALFAGSMRIALVWTVQSFSLGLGMDLSAAVHERLLYQPYAFHMSRNSSELIAAQEKVLAVTNNVIIPSITGFTAAVTSLFIVAILFYIDTVAAGIAVLSIAAIYLVVSYFTRQRLHHHGTVVNAAYNQRVQAVQESLGGIRDILIDQSQPVYIAHYAAVNSRLRRAAVVAGFISNAPRFVVEAIGMVLIALLALFMTARSGGFAAALPVLGALALSAQRLLPLLQQVYYSWAQIRQGTPLARDIARLLELEVPPERVAPASIAALPFNTEIRLDRVGFTYPGRAEPALDDVNLLIPRGAKVALVGKTGSGKSTLVDILMGLLEPTTGSVTIDNQAPTGTAMLAWQAQIAHVPQAIFLADTTIERNIAFGAAEEGVDAERVRAAARLAQVHDFIDGLPEGYQTTVGERGIRLSGGQRQRLGIARALYKGSSVLVLDEATSALDGETEAAVIAGLAAIDETMTIVMIAHRLSTVAKCDTIVRLDGGRIVEVGSYAKVIGQGTQRDMDRKFG